MRPRPHPAPSQPSTPSTVRAPFRSTQVGLPTAGPLRSLLPVRLPWMGLVLIDPYWWAPAPFDQTALLPGRPPPRDDRPVGGLQLDVEPRHALVYVDGWFMGVVDEFSGYYHHLDLAAGPHLIELLASDYDPLPVDIVVSPGRTTTYRGSLNRR
jgi:hypothetical protein